MTVIYGAGLAGLLAGSMLQTAKIVEAGPEGMAQHKAVLRFRSSAVGDAVGIDFRRVRVHKGIWHDGRFVEPNIQLANMYSQKVIGKLADRSVWNLDPCDRFIAPEDFISQLAERCRGRIEWNHPVTADEIERETKKIVSTIPMSVMAKLLLSHEELALTPEFKHEPITVRRWRIHGADVFQTIYFPSPETKLYRASITGDLLIAEYVGDGIDDNRDGRWGGPLVKAFGLSHVPEEIETTKQRYGKIAKIDDAWRKRFIFDLSSHYNIFSLGRFGTWRNILLDDALNDISVIKKLMNTSTYDRSKHSAK
jgi:hypothetical protein